jgi:hypothetical protein
MALDSFREELKKKRFYVANVYTTGRLNATSLTGHYLSLSPVDEFLFRRYIKKERGFVDPWDEPMHYQNTLLSLDLLREDIEEYKKEDGLLQGACFPGEGALTIAVLFKMDRVATLLLSIGVTVYFERVSHNSNDPDERRTTEYNEYVTRLKEQIDKKKRVKHNVALYLEEEV